MLRAGILHNSFFLRPCLTSSPPHPPTLLTYTHTGVDVIPTIIPRLPFGSNHLGISEDTTIALLCLLMELSSDNVDNARYM